MAKPIVIKVTGDDKGFQKSMGRVDKSIGGMTSSVKKAAGLVGGALAAAGLVQFGTDAVNLASDFEEGLGAASTIFGDAFGTLESGLKDSATAMGINRADALELANGYGVLFKDLTDAERAAATLDATARAADVGSMFNEDPAAVAAAFAQAINGSSEVVRKFGIDTSDAAVKQFALENGIEGVNGKLTEADKKLIRHQIIMRDSDIAAGNFADTSDGLANKQRILSARFDNLKITLGSVLMPVILGTIDAVESFVGVVKNMTEAIIENEPLLAALTIAVAGLAVIFLSTAIPAVIAYASAWAAAAAAVIVANAPVILITAAIALLVAGVIWAYQNVEIFRDTVDTVWAAVKVVFDLWLTGAKLLFDGIVLAVGLAIDIVQELWDKAGEVASGFKDDFQELVDFIKELPGKIGEAASGLWDAIPKPPAFITDTIGAVGGFLGFARGGTVPGGTHLVGERGPELVNLPGGSQITPNHAINGNGSVVVNVTSSADPWLIGREVAWAIRTGGV